MPQGYFSYVRVSTARQGQTGTSLAEQREAIARYSQRWGLSVVREFEETETAARRGRPVFSQMLSLLKRGQARGVIIHKIDRGARNLRDWAELGDLIDAGFEVHFANENLDLYSRGGRLSADIQAVVAADYIRNLREEVKKGFYGRIKQGFYPMPAPIGYRDMGKAQAKEPDPVQGPLVRKAFDLYATGRYGLLALAENMYSLGLRTKSGLRVSKNTLARMLHNPFYTGLIRIKLRGEMFRGQHRPIVPQVLFDRVQAILSGKNVDQKRVHSFVFRRALFCASCSAKLIGELQKGHVYYRCQTRHCPQKTIREEIVEEALSTLLEQMRFTERENAELRIEIKRRYERITEFREAGIRASPLQLEQLRSRLSKLTDAYIDGVLDRDIYLEKKNALITEERVEGERLQRLEHGAEKILERVEQFLELVNRAHLSYKLANEEEKRELVQAVTSNLAVEGKSLIVKLNYPFQLVAERQKFSGGGANRRVTRTLSALLSQLADYFQRGKVIAQEHGI
ncbi:MAG: recombinase family protein [Acidobacteriota bacterium]|nr:recombinase family protein [Acidobacteriota bacterium]